MDSPAGIFLSARRRPSLPVMALLSAWALFTPLATLLPADSLDGLSWPAAGREARLTPPCGVEELLGIPIYPGSELIALEGPSLEVVDIRRPGWEFTTAEVVIADFLVSEPLPDLRRFYSNLCVRDPLLMQVRKDGPGGEIVSVRHAGRHPLHPRKRWLRITTYRLPPAHPEGK